MDFRKKLGDVIKIAGFRNDVRRLLQASDLFILPTVYEGGCSQALLEAMEEGLPIVVSDTSAVSEVIRHEHSGLLVPPADAPALTAAARRLLRDSALARDIGANARHDAEAFSAERSFEHTFLRLRRAMSPTGLNTRRVAASSLFTTAISSSKDIVIRPDDPRFRHGWYEIEHSPEGRAFRWMADQSTIATRIVVDRPTIVEIAGYSALTRGAIDHLSLFVNGVPAVRAETWREARNHDWICSWRVEPQPDRQKAAEIRLVSAHATRPCALDPGSQDTRNLSIAVSTLTIRAAT